MALTKISTDTIADSAITAAKIADGTVVAADVADNAVTGAKIAMGSDAAGDILTYNGTDYIRLAKGTAAQVLKMNAGATAVEWGTAAGGIAVPGSSVAGDTLYHNGTIYTRLAKGTASQVLTMNAGATAPEWAAAGGGTWIPLQEVEANNSSTSITFTEPAFNATYTNYVIIFNKLNAATANAQPRYEFYSGSWLSANYRWAHFGYDANNNERKDSNQGVATIGDLDGWGIEGGSAHGLNGIIHCWNPLAAVQPTFHMALSGMSYTGYFKVSQGVLANGTTGAVTNMRFSLSTGNIETGEFRLYGIKDS